MKKLTHKSNQKGFTIIEVLIVLAIAGLIMLVVFLAVPALNRNSHNNQYKTEASNLLGAYQEVSNNNGGAPLTASANGAGDALAVKTAANTKTLTNVSIVAQTVTAQAPTLGSGAVFVLKSKCTAANSNVPANSTDRAVALIYPIETTGGGTAYQCVEE